MTHIPFQKNSFPISNEEDVCVVFCFGLCGPKTNAVYQRERKAEQVLLDVVLWKSVSNGGPVLDGRVDVSGYHAVGAHRVYIHASFHHFDLFLLADREESEGPVACQSQGGRQPSVCRRASVWKTFHGTFGYKLYPSIKKPIAGTVL